MYARVVIQTLEKTNKHQLTTSKYIIAADRNNLVSKYTFSGEECQIEEISRPRRPCFLFMKIDGSRVIVGWEMNNGTLIQELAHQATTLTERERDQQSSDNSQPTILSNNSITTEQKHSDSVQINLEFFFFLSEPIDQGKYRKINKSSVSLPSLLVHSERHTGCQ